MNIKEQIELHQQFVEYLERMHGYEMSANNYENFTCNLWPELSNVWIRRANRYRQAVQKMEIHYFNKLNQLQND